MSDLPPGTLISERYVLGEIIGEGSMGVVYEGEHFATGRPLAVKVLRPHVAANALATKRFFQEARAAAQLSHPNVVSVLDVGIEDDKAYLVLERLDGETLEDRLKRAAPLGPRETLDVMLPVLDALGLAHETGIIHRDIKPANIVLSRGPRGRMTPKLLDFGIAKLIEAAPGEGPMTHPGSILGTLKYMAPDFVLCDDPVTASCDVWSAGVVIYRCLTGQLPYVAPSPVHQLTMVAASEHTPVRDLAPWVCEPLARVVEKALKRDRLERYPNATALALALFDAAREAEIGLSPATELAMRAPYAAPPQAAERSRSASDQAPASSDRANGSESAESSSARGA